MSTCNAADDIPLAFTLSGPLLMAPLRLNFGAHQVMIGGSLSFSVLEELSDYECNLLKLIFYLLQSACYHDRYVMVHIVVLKQPHQGDGEDVAVVLKLQVLLVASIGMNYKLLDYCLKSILMYFYWIKHSTKPTYICKVFVSRVR